MAWVQSSAAPPEAWGKALLDLRPAGVGGDRACHLKSACQRLDLDKGAVGVDIYDKLIKLLKQGNFDTKTSRIWVSEIAEAA